MPAKKNPTYLEKKVSIAKNFALTCLKEHGIEDTFAVKVKPFPKKFREAIGLYRAMTQFRGHHQPIFWINEELPQLLKEGGVSSGKLGAVLGAVLVDTLLHEVGHQVAEAIVKVGSLELKGMYVGASFDDEEEFAESVAHHLTNRSPDVRLTKILRQYVVELGS